MVRQLVVEIIKGYFASCCSQFHSI